jgi:serine protease Do
MRKASAAGVRAVVVVVGAMLMTTVAGAQTRVDPDSLQRRSGVFGGLGNSIGATVRDFTSEEIATSKTEGAVVENVQEGGPAAKAGLKNGDVVVAFDGERVRSARHLARLINETAEGRTVKATVLRGSMRETLNVTPEPAGRRFAESLPNVERELGDGLRQFPRPFVLGGGPGDLLSPGRLGVAVEPLSDQLAEFFGAKKGVLVSSVVADSPAAKAGLKAGDVMTSINGHTVSDPAQLILVVRQIVPGTTVDIGIVRDKKSSTLKATLAGSETRRPGRTL